jgi:hypothetical protein
MSMAVVSLSFLVLSRCVFIVKTHACFISKYQEKCMKHEVSSVPVIDK